MQTLDGALADLPSACTAQGAGGDAGLARSLYAQGDRGHGSYGRALSRSTQASTCARRGGGLGRTGSTTPFGPLLEHARAAVNRAYWTVRETWGNPARSCIKWATGGESRARALSSAAPGSFQGTGVARSIAPFSGLLSWRTAAAGRAGIQPVRHQGSEDNLHRGGGPPARTFMGPFGRWLCTALAP
ncbi:hypothetical protein T492DRAFT_1110846 [Pavlovales sp. CCMP2436]|nr:hypothetical protein T492DRAFT_1110846 [Pavlovales sp. CCMP2436]